MNLDKVDKAALRLGNVFRAECRPASANPELGQNPEHVFLHVFNPGPASLALPIFLSYPWACNERLFPPNSAPSQSRQRYDPRFSTLLLL